MYDVKSLEEDWKKYQTKKRKPVIVLLLLLFLVIMFFLIFMQNYKISFHFLKLWDNPVSHKNKFDTPQTPIFSNKTLVNKALKRLETRKVNPLVTNVNDVSTDLLVDIPILDEDSESTIQEDKTQSVKKKNEKVYLNIIETSSITAYEDVEKRFLQSHDIDDALFLAKSYYKKGNYTKAMHWAYETNKLDQNLEEGFLIFIKSKMKLGQKNEVISLLNTYIKHTHAEAAKSLLKKIEENKF